MASSAIPQAASYEPQPENQPWSVPHRIFFRFLCGYFVLYSLPSANWNSVVFAIPGNAWFSRNYIALWHTICVWVATHFFHLSGSVINHSEHGTSDSPLDYIQILMFILTALAAALIWSLLDRKRGDHRGLEKWLRLLVRYQLALAVFAYGFVKVFPSQFRAPTLERLIEPYGDFSPMGVLWSFMGSSFAYTIFGGVGEVLGGLLLLFRRTTTLGALVLLGVLSNVVMMNFCYDVDVKMYSTNLLLMAVYLISPDLRRLIDVFLRNRPARPLDLSGIRFQRRWVRIAAIAFQIFFVSHVLVGRISGGWQAYKTRYYPPRPPIYGLYEVVEFTRNGQQVPPLITDGTRWRRLIAETPGSVTVKTMSDASIRYKAEYEVAKSALTLSTEDNAKGKYILSFTRPDPDHLVLDGRVATDLVSIRLRKIDTSQFLLLRRGFHWTNYAPFDQ
ncbi:MAG TPA: hypothetical protein VKB79_13695 [Bryobacteraceae bacterium]|nr:hypothetical protein [Bryobacteraceae bacterium]